MDGWGMDPRLLLPLVAVAGFTLLLERRGKLPMAFAPAAACACVAVCLTLASLVSGLLYPVTVGLWGLGAAAFAAEIWLRRKRLKALLCAPLVFWGVMLIYAAFRLKGVVFLHYDNFSHWALITDWLLRTDRLPGAGDALIRFTAYPPASAMFAYFLARAAEGGESAMAFGQAVWLSACGAGLCAFAQKRKALCWGVIAAAWAAILACNIFIDELLVDTLLPVVGLCALLAALQGRNDPLRALPAVLPMAAALVLIKASGLFFVLPAAAVLINGGFRQSKRKGWLCLGWLALSCGAALMAWRLHVTLTFGAAQGKHAVDMGAYAAGLAAKWQSGVLWQTTKNFIKRLIDPYAIQNQLLAALLAGLLALTVACPKGSRGRRLAGQGLTAALILWAAWQAGIYGMYAFSASDREALNLSGQQRYALSMIVYLTGLSAALVCRWLGERPALSGRRALACAAAVIWLAAAPLTLLRGQLPCLWRTLNPSTRRVELQALLEAEGVEPGKRYVLYVNSFEDVSYVSYVARYLLRSDAVTVTDGSAYQDELPPSLRDCDYLIFADRSGEVKAFAETLLNDPAYPPVTVAE